MPPNPTFPAGSVQMYLAQDVKLGTGLNVFTPTAQPTDPCRTALQIRVVPLNPVHPDGLVQVVADDTVAPVPDIVVESLADFRPSLDRCVASSVDQ